MRRWILKTLSEYDIKGKEKTSGTSEKKEKARNCYVHKYKYGKRFWTLNYKCACAAQKTAISKMKEIVDMWKYDIEEINAINRDIREHIDSFHKEYESCAAYTEHRTVHFNSIANINVYSDSITPQKTNGREENV